MSLSEEGVGRMPRRCAATPISQKITSHFEFNLFPRQELSSTNEVEFLYSLCVYVSIEQFGLRNFLACAVSTIWSCI